MTDAEFLPNNRQKLIAWGIHAYTALGGVLGIFALALAAQHFVREAYVLLVVQMIIDATDGMMARRVRIKEVLPDFDGAMMDNVIDILTYAWIPLFIILHENLLPHPIFIVPAILAALYAYGQVNMKSDDGYFVGFPTYWNIVALYLYWLRPEGWIAVLIVLVPAVLSFIPTRYLYPSKGEAYWRSAWGLGTLWFVVVLFLLSQEQPTTEWVLASLLFPAWYMAVSFYVEWRVRRERSRQ